jgi:vancomycin resistance protein YoaR
MLGAVLLAFGISMIGFLYAGSPDRLAGGVTIAGVDVGGLSPGDARTLLEHRSARLARVPVLFVSGSHKWEITPDRLGVKVDWSAAVESARRQGGGFGPFRGLRRLELRVFGGHIEPPVQAWHAALAYQLGLFAKVIDRPHRDASVQRRGLNIVVVPGQDGRVLDRQAAASVVVHALGALSRHTTVLPIRVDAQQVQTGDLTQAAAQAHMALSAPIMLALGPTRYRIPRWRIASLLQLPAHGSTKLAIGGPGAEHFFVRLSRAVGRPPSNADWMVTTKGIRVVPARNGLVLQRAPTEQAILNALLSPTNRVAQITVSQQAPSRSTAEAQGMGITGVVGGFETFFGGDPNRIHNVQLVSHLIDRTLIAPGSTFSFNNTTGDRNAAKGFLEAPVIINGELSTGLGGGVCQVSTTVFNAAYVAGLDITERTNHALYISHYPLGRDATVNYPDTDLKFVNDTPHWLLLRTFVSSDSLTVNLYGTPAHRRVDSVTAPLTTAGPIPVKRIDDPSLLKGQSVVIMSGTAPLKTSVQRKVYSPSGKLLHDDTWYSSYRNPDDYPRRDEAPAEAGSNLHFDPAVEDLDDADHDHDHSDDDDADYDSAVAIASASEPGTRVARNVSPSTHACAVQPSAIRSSPRSITYSKRKRAPRRSPQRARTTSRSSNRAGTL